MNREDIISETDPEKLRSLALDFFDKKLELDAEIALLLRRISELTQQLADARDQDRQLALQLELRHLHTQLAALNQEKFGRKSERRENPEDEPVDKPPPKPKKRPGPTPQPKLPLDEVIHPLDEADKICPECGDGLCEMKGQFEEREEVSIIERSYRLVRHKRQKYRCRCGHLETALADKRLIPGGRYSTEFAVASVVDKYADHLPLERQVARMERAGLAVTSQTLFDQHVAIYQAALPTILAIRRDILGEDLVHADETTWPMLGKGKTEKWWGWAVSGERGVYYQLVPSRGTEAGLSLLEGYDGIVMADAYPVYGKLSTARSKASEALPFAGVEAEAERRKLPQYQLVTCWMHARRPFFHARKSDPVCEEMLDLIGQLYSIEKRAATGAKDEDELLANRRALREAESRGVIEKIRVWRDRTRGLPKSKLGEGLSFLRNQWEGLTAFLEDPCIPLDNGHAERRMRGLALGRKNHQGSRSELGARVSAGMYTLVESARVVGVDPAAYVQAVIKQAVETPGSVLLPRRFLEQQQTVEHAER